jgi:hypothetical protein
MLRPNHRKATHRNSHGHSICRSRYCAIGSSPPDAPLAHCCWPPSAILLSCGDCSREGRVNLAALSNCGARQQMSGAHLHRPWRAIKIRLLDSWRRVFWRSGSNSASTAGRTKSTGWRAILCMGCPRATAIMAMFRLRLHASDDTASQGACGCAAPGSREPRRCASRPSGFDPLRKNLMSPSPGQSIPGPAKVGGAMLTLLRLPFLPVSGLHSIRVPPSASLCSRRPGAFFLRNRLAPPALLFC